MCDVRSMSDEETRKVFASFKGMVPKVRWDGNEAHLTYEKEGKEIRLKRYTIKRGEASVEFYPGVSNIRFDGYLKDIDWSDVNGSISSGNSKNALDYI